ncbi:hypothetical protein ACA910_017023 [Epithemia clementina (nom. ined.)]
MVEALRHSFRTEHDPRSVIGPVGVPFGFANQGHYELKVFDFELIVGGKQRGGRANNHQNGLVATTTSGLVPGFYLQRFVSEAAYAQYLNQWQTNVSSCSFDYFLDDDDDDDEDDPLVNTNNNNNNNNKNNNNQDDTIFAEMGAIPSAEHGILLMMIPPQTKWKPATPSIDYTFTVQEAGLYFLTYQICIRNPQRHPDAVALLTTTTTSKQSVRSTFELDFHFLNVVGGRNTYLTVGELHLPFLFFFFAASYLICCLCWIVNLYNIGHGGPGLFSEKSPRRVGAATAGGRTAAAPVVYPIHKLMAALLTFKFLSVFFECLRYHAIRITGHAEVWSVLYYTISFVKGIFLFTVILLIGTGWSFVKPFLNVNEKRIVFSILVLQVINNLAIVVLSHETAGERGFDRWNALLHLVDIICCCAVLLPIVWQVNALEKSLPASMTREEDDDDDDDGESVRLVGRRCRMDEHDIPDEDEEELAAIDQITLGGASHDNNRGASASLNQDEADPEEDLAEKGQILSKLRLFRSFYLLVVAYIYFTRIIVYLFATLLDYRHLWIRYAIIEVVTLAFYVVIGILFRPMAENPYLSIRPKKEESNNNNNGDYEDSTGIAMPVVRSSTTKKDPSKA